MDWFRFCQEQERTRRFSCTHLPGSLTPYIGWFIFTPVLLCTAIGAGLLTFFQRKAAAPPVKA